MDNLKHQFAPIDIVREAEIRKDFEDVFVIPKNCEWNGKTYQIVRDSDDNIEAPDVTAVIDIRRYWEGWKAAACFFDNKKNQQSQLEKKISNVISVDFESNSGAAKRKSIESYTTTRYRKLSFAIEAMQLTSETLGDVLAWIEDYATLGDWNWTDDDKFVNIATLEGLMRASENDYIVLGAYGEMYPVKCEIFENTYEKVD